jgi:formylmethanofuran dehydrogenase subunit D
LSSRAPRRSNAFGRSPIAVGRKEKYNRTLQLASFVELEQKVTKRFNLNASRSSKQGTLINVGKDSEEYRNLTNTMTMAAQDMAELGLAEGQMAIVRTQFGEATFKCQSGKVPVGMIFVPYGPPTCKLMGGDTDGTGMPTSKGWEVEVVPA